VDVLPFFLQACPWEWGHWYLDNGWGWWMVFVVVFAAVWMLAFLGLITWAVVTLVQRAGGGNAPPAARPTELEILRPKALEILEERYARGEVSHEEFDNMRARLLRDRF
jgi:putative membrane protein